MLGQFSYHQFFVSLRTYKLVYLRLSAHDFPSEFDGVKIQYLRYLFIFSILYTVPINGILNFRCKTFCLELSGSDVITPVLTYTDFLIRYRIDPFSILK